MKRILFILLIGLLPLLTNAQKWINYTTADGLADNTVNAIAIDADGNKWFATELGGVSEFDGVHWTTYNTTNGLTSNRVRAIAIDAQGNKWFGTIGGGVSKFDGKNWTTYNTYNGLPNNNVQSITIDALGNKWIATGAGVSKFDGTTWTTFNYEDLANGANTVAIDAQGKKWVGTIDGIYTFDDVTWKNVIFDYVWVSDIVIDKSGNIWAAKYGSSKFDGITWTTYYSPDDLMDNRINTIYVDSVNTKWFGTWTGLSKYDGMKWTTYKSVDVVGTKRVNAIVFDKAGDLWVGTSEGGVSKLEHASIKLNTDTVHIPGIQNSQQTFDVISNTSWTTTCNQDWLTVSPATGSNNATFTLTALENSGSSQRNATVTVLSNGISKYIIVNQASIISGLNSISEDDIQFYPIPISDKLHIKSLKSLSESTITIYSINGSMLYNSKINSRNVEIDMSKYASGLYYAKIITKEGNVLTKKIVK
jgi:ligand-binding sensor domain-containing protein